MRNRKLLIAIALLAAIGVHCSCLGPFLYSSAINSLRLRRFANSLHAYPLPPGTEVVARYSKVGNFGPAGNHCDYMAALILVTELTRDEIDDYYRNMALPQVGDSECRSYNLIFQDEVEAYLAEWGRRYVGAEYDELLYNELALPSQQRSDARLRFCIEVYDTHYDAGFDCRCM